VEEDVAAVLDGHEKLAHAPTVVLGQQRAAVRLVRLCMCRGAPLSVALGVAQAAALTVLSDVWRGGDACSVEGLPETAPAQQHQRPLRRPVPTRTQTSDTTCGGVECGSLCLTSLVTLGATHISAQNSAFPLKLKSSLCCTST
jgi:hypothetical protein